MRSDYRTIGATMWLAVVNVNYGLDNAFCRINNRYTLVVLHICTINQLIRVQLQ